MSRDSVEMAQWFRSGISEPHAYSIGRAWAIFFSEIYKEPDGMYVVWLSPSERGGFTGTFRESELYPSGSLRHCCIWGKGPFGSIVQQ